MTNGSQNRDAEARERLHRLRRTLAAGLESTQSDEGLAETYVDVRRRLEELTNSGAIELENFDVNFPVLSADNQTVWPGRSTAELIRQLAGYIDALSIGLASEN